VQLVRDIWDRALSAMGVSANRDNFWENSIAFSQFGMISDPSITTQEAAICIVRGCPIASAAPLWAYKERIL
jgi:hypothetical protein